MTKVRPILFNGDMVRALLDGRKTMTRRVVKPPPSTGAFVLQDYGKGWWPYKSDDGESVICSDGNEHPMNCPYGVPGDLLYVRETWADHWGNFLYRATAGATVNPVRWKPSIHMAREDSRLTLRITDVRVERVQDISETDAKAEGVTIRAYPTVGGGWNEDPESPLSGGFGCLWDSINADTDHDWDANPWVWVVAFQVIKKNVDEVLACLN